MDLEQIFLPALVAVTSLGAFFVGAWVLRLRAAGLRRAAARTLEALGLLMLFGALNLGVGAVVVLAWRGITGEFLSFYLLNDAVLGIFSLLQALTFQWWWARAD